MRQLWKVSVDGHDVPSRYVSLDLRVNVPAVLYLEGIEDLSIDNPDVPLEDPFPWVSKCRTDKTCRVKLEQVGRAGNAVELDLVLRTATVAGAEPRGLRHVWALFMEPE